MSQKEPANVELANPLAKDMKASVSQITSVIVDILREAELLRKSWTLPDVSQRIAEECYKIVSSKFMSTSRELAMLLRFKENLLIQVEEESRVLKKLNKKLEQDSVSIGKQYEDRIKLLERDLQNLKCDHLALQKRLFFATRRELGPNDASLSKSIDEPFSKDHNDLSVVARQPTVAKTDSTVDNETKISHKYNPFDLPLKDDHKHTGYMRDSYRKEKHNQLRISIQKGQASAKEEPPRQERLLPSLLQKQRSRESTRPAVPDESSIDRPAVSASLNRTEMNRQDSGERFFKHSFQFTKNLTTEGRASSQTPHLDSTFQSKSSDMQRSLILKQKLPVMANFLHIDYEKFGVMDAGDDDH